MNYRKSPPAPFAKGVRVRIKESWSGLLPKKQAVLGTIIGWSNNPQCRRIMWDGRKTPDSVNICYLEIVPFGEGGKVMTIKVVSEPDSKETFYPWCHWCKSYHLQSNTLEQHKEMGCKEPTLRYEPEFIIGSTIPHPELGAVVIADIFKSTTNWRFFCYRVLIGGKSRLVSEEEIIP